MLKFFNFRKLIEDNPYKKKKIVKSYVPISQDESKPQSDVEHIFCLYYGIGIKKDEEYAKQLCLNDTLKENLIVKGIKYYNGWDVERDFKKSFECFKKFYDDNQFDKGKVKEKGYCLNMIAYFYKEGKGVPKNTELAISLYKKAIEMGNSMAMNNLAYLHKSGKGMKKDVNRAIELYEEAIQQGNISSMYNLAYLYEQGDGIEKDLKKAIHLYEKAIKMRNTMAMNNLAMIYKNGKGIKKDIKKAIDLYENAIDLNNKNAMYNLAYLYEEGKEVPKDIHKAINLYKLSCDQGNSSAYNNLGMIYKKGTDGIERNINEAVSLFERAIELGNKNSMINLAILYEEGFNGFQVDMEKSAFYFYKLVCCFDENEYSFKRKLSEILSSGSVEWQIDYHQFWRSSYFLDSQIKTLLLISKSRRDSLDDCCSFLVRGITMMIIKHLCHYSQI